MQCTRALRCVYTVEGRAFFSRDKPYFCLVRRWTRMKPLRNAVASERTFELASVAHYNEYSQRTMFALQAEQDRRGRSPQPGLSPRNKMAGRL